MLHFKASKDEKEFLDDRMTRLNDYLIDLVKHASPDDYSFWNHPSIMTFFDIPIIHCQRGEGGNHKAEWMMEFEKLQEMIEDFSHNYNNSNVIDGKSNAKNRTKRTIRKMIRDLGINPEGLDKEQTELLQSIRDKFHVLIGGAISTHSTEDSDKSDLLSRTTRPSWTLLPPTSSLSVTNVNAINTNGGHDIRTLEEISKKQHGLIDQQDSYLSEISAAVHRQKLIAQELLKESEEQNKILDSTQQSISTTQSRVHDATGKAKKLP
jgi:hypothetical protein